MTEKQAKEIISMCDQLEINILSQTASIKAKMAAYLGGVGTPHDKQKKSSKKIEQEAEIRARFRRKK